MPASSTTSVGQDDFIAQMLASPLRKSSEKLFSEIRPNIVIDETNRAGTGWDDDFARVEFGDISKLSQPMRAAYYGYGALSYKWSRGVTFLRSLLYIGFLDSFSFVRT